MTCVIDKADNFLVIESDSHFSDFVGVHPSKINEHKLYLYDVIAPQDRETIMRKICKKDSPYIYLDMYIKNKDDDYVFLHCISKNIKNSTCCNLTFADVSASAKKSEQLRKQAKEMNHLIDLVNGGVALFKVNRDMHFEPLYLNEACCKFFGTTKENYIKQIYRLDDLIHPDDRSTVFQAIGNSMATKRPIDVELRVMTHKDSYIWCKMSSAIQRYDSDHCPIFHAVFTDITKVKNDEAEADRQNDLMVKLFKNMPGAMFIAELDNPFNLSVVSADFMKLIGYTRKEFFERHNGNLADLMVDKDVNSATYAIKIQSEKSNDIKSTYSIKTRDGKDIVVIDRRKLVDGDNGEKSTIGILQAVNTTNIDEDFEI
jgi:PAS domain S-box-containing protein